MLVLWCGGWLVFDGGMVDNVLVDVFDLLLGDVLVFVIWLYLCLQMFMVVYGDQWWLYVQLLSKVLIFSWDYMSLLQMWYVYDFGWCDGEYFFVCVGVMMGGCVVV